MTTTYNSDNRITRSSAARLAATDSKDNIPASVEARTIRKRPGSDTAASPIDHAVSRKRKAEQSSSTSDVKPNRTRSKRLKVDTSPEAGSLSTAKQTSRSVARAHHTRTMSSGPPTSSESADTSPHAASRESLSKKKSHGRKSKDDLSAADTSSSRRPRRGLRRDRDAIMVDADEKQQEETMTKSVTSGNRPTDANPGADDADTGLRRLTDELMDRSGPGDPFAGGYLSRLMGQSGLAGLSGHLRALSGMTSGTANRLRTILEQLKAKEDPSMQLVALQELSELLLVSTEDNLAGHFAPDQFVKELVTLMQPNEITGEENPETMLIACRCIANMMEALPASTASVVYGGAVPVLCQKLLEIHFIDLAEQALSTLEKISVDFPSSIVREGGLTACLTYLDFFPTSTQRTAVTTAANCCRNISDDAFPTVRDVMPILLNTLSSSDQRVVEQASLCVSRIVDSFKYSESKLEELVSPDLLKAILRLLLPGSTNMISSSTHTSFLRLLSITARASPRLSIDLLRMDLVGTLYQILTGVSPPSINEQNLASKIDKNVIMQAIIRTPRDQVFETLNVICEILPSPTSEDLGFLEHLSTSGFQRRSRAKRTEQNDLDQNRKRVKLLQAFAAEVRAFTVILFPTLVHAYFSTVNFHVREKVLRTQIKMLSNLDVDILQEALSGVAYASHLASILSQQDNPILITYALQATELLLKRLGSVYQPQLVREGVFAEIERLARRPLKNSDRSSAKSKSSPEADSTAKSTRDAEVQTTDTDLDVDMSDVCHIGNGADVDTNVDADGSEADDRDHDHDHDHDHDRDDDDDDDDDEEGAEEEDEEDDDDDSGDDDNNDHHDHKDNNAVNANRETDSIFSRSLHNSQDTITARARGFLDMYGTETVTSASAAQKLQRLQSLSRQLEDRYTQKQLSGDVTLFQELAGYFSGGSPESVTSYELMTSGIVDGLFRVLNIPNEDLRLRVRRDFVSVFMATDHTTGNESSHATPFAILLHKLQELLSRSEQYEVVTVHHNAFESSRAGAASMLARQLKLQLVADDNSGIPRAFRRIGVSIHAIATFKALNDYLHARIVMVEKPRHQRLNDRGTDLSAYLAAMRDNSNTSQPPVIPSTASPSAQLASTDDDQMSNRGLQKDTHLLSERRRKSQHQVVSAFDKTDKAPVSETAADLPTSNQLECADETHYTEHEDEGTDADFEAEIDALVEEFEDEAIQDGDPSAVNMEVEKSGKVSAHTEDGARISTPSQQSTPVSAVDQDRLARAQAKVAGLRDVVSTPTSVSSSSRLMTYASALQTPPKDWHLEFSINGQPLSDDTTIYRACHFDSATQDSASHRGVWQSTHTISYRRVDGSSRESDNGTSSATESGKVTDDAVPPLSLSHHPVTATILRLMGILHDLNIHLEEITADENGDRHRYMKERPAQFVNAKLTAKLNRQLEEPLIVASNCLPTWSEELTRLYPFLFPFETRHLYLSSTSFGYSRSMTRWQNAQPEDNRHGRHHREERPFLGRLQRQKVRISRHRILESGLKVMDMYGSSPSILEVEYFEEVGTGLGPTLEFYSSVSREFSKKKTKLWRENDSFNKGEYASGKQGLFPAPMTEDSSKTETSQRVLQLFKVLGKFIARSMLDSRIIDVSFNPAFFRFGRDSHSLSLPAVATVDAGLASSLKMLRRFSVARRLIEEDASIGAGAKAAKIAAIEVDGAKLEDLALDFTLPAYPLLELVPAGAQQAVTIDNVDQYIERVIDLTLGSGIQRQHDAFKSGFSQVFPFDALQAFTPAELVMMFGRTKEDWSLETLMDSIKADHGYNLDSKNVKNLLQTMSEFSDEERRGFLQFVTGSPKLPIGGFKSLTPMFTVVRKPAEAPLTSDDYLPSVMTCVNYLKMPDYSSPEILRNKLRIAVREGQGSFHLS